MKKGIFRRAAAFLPALAMVLSACGSRIQATTMHLKRTEGLVGVADSTGQPVAPRDELSLFSGYSVDTGPESFAWVDLDSVKLTKLDEESAIEITKNGRALEIEVKSGSLFFNITEPLEEDESLTIRCSTMVVGIRGTCGWVQMLDEKNMNIALLEGKVECTAKDQRASVSAGEIALLSEEPEQGEITIQELTAEDVPAFVGAEVAVSIPETPPDDGGGPEEPDEPDEPDEPEPDPDSERLSALAAAGYIGDPRNCAMTAEQAAAFAGALREAMEDLQAQWEVSARNSEEIRAMRVDGFALLFDTGSGVPALFFSGGCIADRNESSRTYSWTEIGQNGLWTYSPTEGMDVTARYGGYATILYEEHLLCGGVEDEVAEEQPAHYRMFPLTLSGLSHEPDSTAEFEVETVTTPASYRVDGEAVTQREYNAWLAEWNNRSASLAGITETGVGGSSWGLYPVDAVLAALDAWTGGGDETAAGEGSRYGMTVTYREPDVAGPVEASIRRTTVAVGERNIELYSELPEFGGEELQPVTAFFEDKQSLFLAENEIEDLFENWDLNAREAGTRYQMTAGVEIQTFTDTYLYVTQKETEYTGGRYGSTVTHRYHFRSDTGEQLFLSDVLDADPETVRAYIWAELDTRYWGGAAGYSGAFRYDDIDRYTFWIEDGVATVECDAGRSGAFLVYETVELPYPLKAEFR